MDTNTYSVLFLGINDQEGSSSREAVVRLVEDEHYRGISRVYIASRKVSDKAVKLRDRLVDAIRVRPISFRKQELESGSFGIDVVTDSLETLLAEQPPDITVIGMHNCPKGTPREQYIAGNLPPTMDYARLFGKYKYPGFVLMLSNPADLLAYAFCSASGLNPQQIGGINETDSHLFRLLLSEYFQTNGISPDSLNLLDHAFVIGGHEADLWVPVFSALEKARPEVGKVLTPVVKATMMTEIKENYDELIRRHRGTALLTGERVAHLVDLLGRRKSEPVEQTATFSTCYMDERMKDRSGYPLPLFIGTKAVVESGRVRPDDAFMRTLSDEERKAFDHARETLNHRLEQLAQGHCDGTGWNTSERKYFVPLLKPTQTGATAVQPQRTIDLAQETGYVILVPTKGKLYGISQGKEVSTEVRIRDESAHAIMSFTWGTQTYLAVGYKNGVLFVDNDTQQARTVFGEIAAQHPLSRGESKVGFRHLVADSRGCGKVYASHPVLGVHFFTVNDIVCQMERDGPQPLLSHTLIGEDHSRRFLPIATNPYTGELLVGQGNAVVAYDAAHTPRHLFELPAEISALAVSFVLKDTHQCAGVYVGTAHGKIYAYDGKTAEEIFSFGKEYPRMIVNIVPTIISSEVHLIFNTAYPNGHTSPSVEVRNIYDMYNNALDINEKARAFVAQGNVLYLRRGHDIHHDVQIRDLLEKRVIKKIRMEKGYALASAQLHR